MRISSFSINIYFSYKKQPSNKDIQKVKTFKVKNDIVFKKLPPNPGKIGKVLFVCLFGLVVIVCLFFFIAVDNQMIYWTRSLPGLEAQLCFFFFFNTSVLFVSGIFEQFETQLLKTCFHMTISWNFYSHNLHYLRFPQSFWCSQ